MRKILAILLLLLPAPAFTQSFGPCVTPSRACLAGGPVRGSVTVYGIIANSTLIQPLFVLPVGAKLRAIYLQSTNVNAVTGGVNIGTAVSGAQVWSGQAVAGNAVVSSAPLSNTWNGGAVQVSLYLSAVTAFNSASLNVEIVWDY